MPRRAIEILHLAFSRYPADTRVKRESQALLATGRRVAVIALRGEGERPVERCSGVVTVRVPGRKTRGGFFSYLRDYLAFVWRCRRLIARHPRLANLRVVHVHTLPDFLLWAALPARRRGAKLVFDMHEIFPEFARSTFGGPAGRALEHVARAVERWARRRADLTVTVNRPIDDLLDHRGIGRSERRLILHNTADPADFGDDPLPGGRAPLPGRALELVYHGTLTHLYGLDIAIRGVAEARRQGIAVQLSIIGDGPERVSLVALAEQLSNSACVRFESPLRQAALPARLGASHAGLVPTRLDGMTRYSLSNKLLEYIHLGIPVLAARLPSYAQYFGEDAAWYWTPGDATDLARAIADYGASSAEDRERRARRAREALTQFTWPRERERLLAAYRDLLAV
jgi:glycosyltransferase involved in cell wall biosynthesis